MEWGSANRSYFNYQIYSSQYANSSNVLLCKDNRLPFVKISKAEYLDKLAEAVERKYIAEKDSARFENRREAHRLVRFGSKRRHTTGRATRQLGPHGRRRQSVEGRSPAEATAA